MEPELLEALHQRVPANKVRTPAAQRSWKHPGALCLVDGSERIKGVLRNEDGVASRHGSMSSWLALAFNIIGWTR